MSSTVDQYRIFIASPGGLDEIRQSFREVVRDYNESDAIRRGVLFTPVRWEETLGGARRPQSLINEDLRSCDAFVLVLWDRWGSPPDVEGPYSSGCEEEFELASQYLKDPRRPMSDLVIFFQAPETRHLLDPGQQLQQVLAFKQKLEKSRQYLFTVFDELSTFRQRLRRHLASWVYAHEQRMPLAAGPPKRPDVLKQSPADGGPGSLALQEAERLASKNRLTEAEAIFVQAIATGSDPEAFNRYGHFLSRVGRLAQAALMYERMLECTESSGAREVDAYVSLGVIYRTRGDIDRAESMRRKAVEIYEQLKSHKGRVAANASLRRLQRTLDIYEQLRNREGMAFG